jgi:hypothetical protein
MASLLDIGPLTEEVEVRGVTLTVQGLTAGHLFQLFSEFPDMRKMIDSKQGKPQDVMLSLAPELLAKIIAMATGSPHDKEAEAKAKSMGASDQVAILEAVQRMSFREGLAPFVERVTALMMPVSTKLPTIPSDNSESSTTNSPAPFSASLQMDTPGVMRGHTRRVN